MGYQNVIRSVIPFFLFSLLFFVSCNQTEITQIEGNVKNNKSSMEVKLFRQDFDKIVLLENLTLKENKTKLVFKVKEINEPTFYQLEFANGRKRTIVLLIEPGEKILLEVDMLNFGDYSLSGSEGSLKTQILNNRLSRTIKTLDSLNNLYINTKNLPEKEFLAEKYIAAIEDQRAFNSQFIWENPMSRASVMALYQQYGEEKFIFDRAEDIQLFKVVGSSLKAMYPESEYTKGVLRDIANQEKILASHKLIEFINQAESSLPEISLPNSKGDTIRLSTLRGKVILLDFWASVNQVSLLENRELLEIYSQFKGKGLEIYQVSLDPEKEKWLTAIKLADLPWISVRAENPDASLIVGSYNISGIPSNYLINKEFDIVGKNLYGKDLIAKLKEIL
jgi:hypothetical protein